MKSNKFLMAFAAILAVSVISCSQNEELVVSDNQFSENAIAFGTYIGKTLATRAGTATDALMNSEAGFGVMAYYTAEDDFGKTSIPNFMYNQQVIYDKANELWTYTPLKYWPNNDGDKISFFAYAPYSSTFGETGITELSGNEHRGDPTLKFKVPTDASEYIDLLYADATTTDENQIKDLTKPEVADKKVTLKFKHALSSVNIQRVVLIDNDKNNALDANTTITIKDIIFPPMDFGTEGTLNLNTGEWADVVSDTYKFNSDAFKSGSNVLNSDNAIKIEDLASIMFIPVSGTSTKTSGHDIISIEYEVKTKDSNLNGGVSTITYNKSVSMPHITFEAGKAYNFLFKIGLTSVKLDAQVAEWEDSSELIGWESIVL